MRFDPILRAIVDTGTLVASARVLAGLMARLDMPEVLGELSARIVLGPFALGSLQIGDQPLAFNEHVLAFAEIEAIPSWSRRQASSDSRFHDGALQPT